MTIRYLVFRSNYLHNLPVISNISSSAPEKNGNDVGCHDLVTFLEVAKSNGLKLALSRFTNFQKSW